MIKFERLGNFYVFYLAQYEPMYIESCPTRSHNSWYIHSQLTGPGNVDLSKAVAGPFPTVKSAKAAARVIFS